MDSFAISIDCCPDMVQRLFTIVKENPVSELTINTVKMSKVEQALKAANETRALRIGSGILNEVAGLFKEQFAGRKAVVAVSYTHLDVYKRQQVKFACQLNLTCQPELADDLVHPSRNDKYKRGADNGRCHYRPELCRNNIKV